MLASAESILNNYIDTSKVSRFTFYSVEMERGENIEDLYYLCTTRDGYYVVFETDYILDTLTAIARRLQKYSKVTISHHFTGSSRKMPENPLAHLPSLSTQAILRNFGKASSLIELDRPSVLQYDMPSLSLPTQKKTSTIGIAQVLTAQSNNLKKDLPHRAGLS